MSNLRPNLFSYGTKELSQDAIICWLIAWSAVEPEGRDDWHLRATGEAFVRALLRKHGQDLAGPVKRASIHQQDHGIDVLALVADQKQRHVLLIEDKTHTGERNGQLKQYLEHVRNGETKVGAKKNWDLLHPIYLKTGNQSLAADRRIEEGKESTYKVFRRNEFLGVLGTYPGNHPILTDFRRHLKNREADFLSFRNWKKPNGGGRSWAGWEGFLVECEKAACLRGPDWRYVAQRDGGFLGFTWGWSDLTGREKAFLQLEVFPYRKDDTRLCFKVGNWDVGGTDSREELQRFWNRYVLCHSEAFESPKRLKVGKSMTVAQRKDEWMAFGEAATVTVPATVANLKAAEGVLDDVVELLEIREAVRKEEWPESAERRLDCKFGRLGFHARGTWDAHGWNPGVFVGVLLDGEDYHTNLYDQEQGDACVLLCLHETLHSTAAAELAFRLLAKDLGVLLRENWTVSNHWNGNRWHPVHIRSPLGTLFEGAADCGEKAQRFHKSAREVVSAVLDHSRELGAILSQSDPGGAGFESGSPAHWSVYYRARRSARTAVSSS